MEHGMWKTLEAPFDEAVAKLPEALAAQGFGVVSEVDLGGTLRAKIQQDVGRYRIFGACNPKLAHEALTRDRGIGIMLPCNVVLHDTAEGKTVLGVIDPVAAVGADPRFAEFAAMVRERLAAVMAAMR